MVPEEKLVELRDRKELVIAQCDLHRGIINLEIARARDSVNWVSRVQQTLHRFRPWLPLAAPAIGFVVARNWRALLRWSGSSIGLKLIGQLLRL